MTADWIRRHYDVPARRGGRIAYTGDPTKGRQLGTIVAFPDSHLRIRLDGQRHLITTHPTWKIEYLPKAEWTLTPDNLEQIADALDELGVFTKAHWAPAPPRTIRPGWSISVTIDGLTIRPHGERIWVRFGETIRLDQLGRYTVHPAAPTATEA
ncbi:hypothetical protein [Kitasatospora sp. NPDC057223]|uniref:hypothetical protein n=1 Tax=Kitasatospora sp. NPDC057223 TaxID=3346055 RepID=UPI0036280A3A